MKHESNKLITHPMIQSAKFFLFFVPFSLFLMSSCHESSLKIVTVTVTSSEGQSYRLENVEVASTTTEHEKGLMHRKSLDSDSGMLFIYPKERVGSFWMKNTVIPLAIAFIDDQGKIIEILHGKPLDVTLLTPSHPYLTVLEVNEGWFSNRNISVGAKVSWK